MLRALSERLLKARHPGAMFVSLVFSVSLIFGSAAYGEEPGGDPQGTLTVEPVYSGIPHDALYDMHIQGDRGVAVGAYGLILESGDSGASWKKREPLTKLALLGVAAGGEHWIIVGQQGSVLLGDKDGGWRLVEGVSEARLLNVDLNSQGLSIAVGEFGTILRSRDYGESWEPIVLDWEQYSPDGYEPHLYGIMVTDGGEVAITGEFGLILWSGDGGENWEMRHKGSQSIFAIDVSKDGVGFAVGQEGEVVRTRDNGKTWERVEVPTSSNLLDVWTGNGEVVITGIRALLLSPDDGDTWVLSKDVGVTRNWYQGIAPAGAGVAADDGSSHRPVIYVSGYRATISRVLY